MESDSCKRAAQAAIEVVREECSGMDVEVRELEDGMFMEIPSEAAEMIDGAANSPVPLDNFEDVISQSGFVRSWLAGSVTSEGVEADATNQAFAERVHTFAESVFDERLDFTADDMVGHNSLHMIAMEA